MTPRTLAAALAAAFATPSLAAEVVVYGLAMPFLETVQTEKATPRAPAERPTMVPATAYTGFSTKQRERISVGTTNIGFRGTEELGGTLKAVWQLESGFQIDENAGPGLGARNSKVGLASPAWGEIFLGQWDTPYKFISLQMSPWRAGYVFDHTGIMGNPGFGVPATTTQFARVPGKPDAAFDKRVGNQVQYWTPRWGGFSARLGWSVDETRTSDGATTAGIRPMIWSGALMYDVGTLSVRYAYERHIDYFGLTQLAAASSSVPASLALRSSRDDAHKVVVLYRIGDTRLAGSFEELRYRNEDDLVGAFREYKRRAYYVTGEQFFAGGAQSVWIAYGRAEDGDCVRTGGALCVATGLGARFYAMGYIYRFSRRTEGYLVYYKLDNKESGTYSPQPVVVGGVAPGADTIGAGVGLIHYW